MKVMSAKRLYSMGLLVLLALGVVAWFFHPVMAAPGGPQLWLTDFRQAQRIAKEKQLPMLLHIYSDHCPPCRQMEAEVLHQPQLYRQLEGRMIAVKLNERHYAQLLDQIGITAVPADVFLSPDGKVIGRTQGYQPLRDYLSRISRVEADWSRSNPYRFAKETRSKQPANSQAASQGRNGHRGDPGSMSGNGQRKNSALGDHDADVPQPILGMNGFSPVFLFDEHDWKRGRREFSGVHKGIIYYMSDEEELAQFNADPEKYAPRLFGCDPVVLKDSDRAIVGRTEFAAYFQKRLYFFVSRESQIQFKANAEKYVELQNVLRLQDIDPSLRR